jgi:UPF0716 family protein affecting phage T7 exclusion
MSTVTRDGRTGYGNKAYRRKFTDVQHISGWVLLLTGVMAVAFLGIALARKNGFATSWHSVIAMVLMETVADTIKRFMVEVASE